jgi:hypothetical protein
MKDKIVINIGYGNAGTSSLNEALNILGYSSTHEADGDVFYDNILETMIEQYPEEYYVYTKRNYRNMYKSARRMAINYGYERPPLFTSWIKDQKEKQLYIESVLKNNLDLNVLEFNVCDEGHGWNELCIFLNEEIPNGKFPHLNKSLI